jgi:hypothetical protein
MDRLGGVHTAPAGGLQQTVKDLLVLIHHDGFCAGRANVDSNIM